MRVQSAECPPENSAKHDNKGRSVNLYAADSLTVQPLRLTVRNEAAVPVPHKETTETFYKLSKIVCVKADSSDTHPLFIITRLQYNVLA